MNQDRAEIGFSNYGVLLQRRMDRALETPLIRAVKSDVENELKRFYPSEAITDEAGRLTIKAVVEFKAKYPELATSKNLRKQLAKNVLSLLLFLYPQLRRLTTLPEAAE